MARSSNAIKGPRYLSFSLSSLFFWVILYRITTIDYLLRWLYTGFRDYGPPQGPRGIIDPRYDTSRGYNRPVPCPSPPRFPTFYPGKRIDLSLRPPLQSKSSPRNFYRMYVERGLLRGVWLWLRRKLRVVSLWSPGESRFNLEVFWSISSLECSMTSYGTSLDNRAFGVFMKYEIFSGQKTVVCHV